MFSRGCSPLSEGLVASPMTAMKFLCCPSPSAAPASRLLLRRRLGPSEALKKAEKIDNRRILASGTVGLTSGQSYEEETIGGYGDSMEKDEWEEEILDEVDPLGFQAPRRRERMTEGRTGGVFEELNDPLEWAAQARKRAILSVRARDPNTSIGNDLFLKKKSSKRQRKKPQSAKKEQKEAFIEGNSKTGKAVIQLPGRRVDHLSITEEDELTMNLASIQIGLEGEMGHVPVGGENSRGSLMNEELRKKEWTFNRRLVEARDEKEVLNTVGRFMKENFSRGGPSLLSPFNVATALHRIARHMENANLPRSERLTFARQREMAELVSAAMEALPSCSAQGLSNISWALSKVGGSLLYWSEMDRLAEATMERVTELNAQNIANIAGAYATMQHTAPRLFAELAYQAANIAESFRPQELAQVMWAFAVLCQPVDLLLDNLDNICNGLGKKEDGNGIIHRLRHERDDISSNVRITSSCIRTPVGSIVLEPQESGNVDKEHGKNIRVQGKTEDGNIDSGAEFVHDVWTRKFEAGRRPESTVSQNEFGEVPRVDPQFDGERRIPESNVLLSPLVFQMERHSLISATKGRSAGGLGTMGEALSKALAISDLERDAMANPFMNANVEQLANIAWSYAVLDEVDRPSFKCMWETLLSHGYNIAESRSTEDGDNDIRCMTQMHQASLCLQMEHPHLGLNLESPLKELVAQVWDKQKSSVISRSVHQKDVEYLLVSTGLEWVAEYTAADYSIDVALVERKIGLEIDGPAHFTRNTGEPLGHTVLKQRLLASSGWKILSVSYQQWEELQGEAEQMQFLQRLLRDHI